MKTSILWFLYGVATMAVTGGAIYGIGKLSNPSSRKTFELRGDLLVSGNPHLKEVALTLDDGPYSESTLSILDTLSKERVRATFFLIGKRIEERPELVRRMLRDGHEVGNHTYSHKRLDELSASDTESELWNCELAFENATGSKMHLMRPPGMRFNNKVLEVCQDLGYLTIHWNVAVGDYVPLEPKVIATRVLNQAKHGSVILLHDCPETARALPEIIAGLKGRGYRFVTTSRMLARLPRPVYVESNAFSVSPDRNRLDFPQISSVSPICKTAKPQVKRGKSGRTRPLAVGGGRKIAPEDAPAWDGQTSGASRSDQ